MSSDRPRGAATMADDVRLPITCDLDIVQARQRGRQLAADAGFTSGDQTVIAAAISEIARNILTLPGETESGDLHLVKSVGSGVLAAVVDGLGHGAEAASAARAAVAVLERHAGESPLPLLQRCHRALIGTRGVVLSLAFFDGA